MLSDSIKKLPERGAPQDSCPLIVVAVLGWGRRSRCRGRRRTLVAAQGYYAAAASSASTDAGRNGRMAATSLLIIVARSGSGQGGGSPGRGLELARPAEGIAWHGEGALDFFGGTCGEGSLRRFRRRRAASPHRSGRSCWCGCCLGFFCCCTHGLSLSLTLSLSLSLTLWLTEHGFFVTYRHVRN